MSLSWARDRHGRLYWFDAASGKRARAPADAARPRRYHVDKRGRGFWTWGDTGTRAPKPTEAPREDRAGRPLDSTGRRIPASAIAEPPEPPKPSKPPSKPPKRRKPPSKPPKRRKTPGAPPKRKRGRPRKPPKEPKPPPVPRGKLKVAQVGPRQRVPGFTSNLPPHFSRPTHGHPYRVDEVFRRRLDGSLNRSPLTTDEIGFRQYGVKFDLDPGSTLNSEQLRRLSDELAPHKMQLVVRTVSAGVQELWLNQMVRTRRRPVIAQQSYAQVQQGMRRGEDAAGTIADFLDAFDIDYDWSVYFETDETLYEGG